MSSEDGTASRSPTSIFRLITSLLCRSSFSDILIFILGGNSSNLNGTGVLAGKRALSNLYESLYKALSFLP